MSTSQDPVADIDQARQALRGLAHATRIIHNPDDTSTVIGDLLAGVRSLTQVLDQLADAHLRHQLLPSTGNGDDAIGVAGLGEAVAAVEHLNHAARLMDAVEQDLDRASQHSGRITWYPTTSPSHAPTPTPNMVPVGARLIPAPIPALPVAQDGQRTGRHGLSL